MEYFVKCMGINFRDMLLWTVSRVLRYWLDTYRYIFSGGSSLVVLHTRFQISTLATKLGVRNITFLGSGLLMVNYLGAIAAAIYMLLVFRFSNTCSAWIGIDFPGQVVLDLLLHIKQPNNHCKILSVTPIAAPQSTRVKFTVKCFNVDQPTSRLLCSFDGKYWLQERILALAKETDRVAENDLSQYLSFFLFAT